jgi:hypothetical protein
MEPLRRRGISWDMRRAFVFHAGTEFKGSSSAVVRYLQGEKFSCQTYDVGDAAAPQPWIDAYPNLMMRVDVIVCLSHGGWDGPMVFGGSRLDLFTSPQIGRYYSSAAWPAVCAWFRNMLTTGGIAVIHACHSAGSNQYESTEANLGRRWVQELAEDARITTVGVEGSTSSAIGSQSVSLLKHALRGTAPPQATRVYLGGGQRVSRWGGLLTQARRTA